MDLTRKIAAGFVAAGLVTVGVGGWTVAEAVASRAHAAALLEQEVALERTVSGLRADALAYDGALSRYVLAAAATTPDVDLTRRTDAATQAARTAVTRGLADARANAQDRLLREKLGRVAAALGDYESLAAGVYDAIAVGEPQEASRAQAVDLSTALAELTSDLDAAQARARVLADEHLAALQRQQLAVVTWTAALAVAVLAQLAALSRYVRRSILRFRSVETGIDALAAGDLGPRDVPDTDDEVGRMNAIVDRTAKTLRDLLEEVRRVTAETAPVHEIEVDRFRGQYRVVAEALVALDTAQRPSRSGRGKRSRRRRAR